MQCITHHGGALMYMDMPSINNKGALATIAKDVTDIMSAQCTAPERHCQLEAPASERPAPVSPTAYPCENCFPQHEQVLDRYSLSR